jgi:hypothetical protein
MPKVLVGEMARSPEMSDGRRSRFAVTRSLTPGGPVHSSSHSVSNMIQSVRWLLTPVACVAAWYVALIVGGILLEVATAFCPKDQMISGSCMAPWYPAVVAAIFCFSAALSAVLVVTTAVFAAPNARAVAAWLAFAIGAIVALWAAVRTSAWREFASAIAAGLLAAVLLARSRFARVRGKPKQAVDADLESGIG